MVLKVPAHFNGQQVVLDAPVPSGWSLGTPLEVRVADSALTPSGESRTAVTTSLEKGDELIQKFFDITKEFFRQTEGQPRAQGRTWKREDAYE